MAPQKLSSLQRAQFKVALQGALHSCSFNSASHLLGSSQFQAGIGTRIYYAFVRVWEWIRPLFSSRKQDRYFKERGREAYYAKINRTRKAFGFAPLSLA